MEEKAFVVAVDGLLRPRKGRLDLIRGRQRSRRHRDDPDVTARHPDDPDVIGGKKWSR